MSLWLFIKNIYLQVSCIFVPIMQQMRFLLGLLVLCMVTALACTSYEVPDSGIECGRQFINATYQGNFKRARQLVIPDRLNTGLLQEKIETEFRQFSSAQKEQLSKTSINIAGIKSEGDTVQYISYVNAYNLQPRTLRCVYRQGEWFTDLAYSFKIPAL